MDRDITLKPKSRFNVCGGILGKCKMHSPHHFFCLFDIFYIKIHFYDFLNTFEEFLRQCPLKVASYVMSL